MVDTMKKNSTGEPEQTQPEIQSTEIHARLFDHPMPDLSTLVSHHNAIPSNLQRHQAALEIRGVQKRFKHFTALNHIDLELRKGELLCFLGPSGCGKTTLLRLIAGLDQIDQGQIFKNGEDISYLKTEKRRCGIVFQNYALFPNLSIAENIAYGLIGKRWSKSLRQSRVAELLALVGLTGSEQKYPLQLSGGQQQRVALARAIAPEPDILLLDEPLSALDARVRLHLRQEIRSLQQRLHMPTILVTHDQEEALTMADRIVVMNHGVIEQVGTPEDIYHHPKTRFVANFIGQMNFLPAKVLSGTELLVAGHLRLSLRQSVDLPVNTEVEIGFRPEAASLVHSNAVEQQTIILSVHLTAKEFLGAQTRLTVAIRGQQTGGTRPTEYLIQIDTTHHHAGRLSDLVHISLDETQLHVFDQAGKTLC
ncbi:putative 2-aminoethylphosphonate ABC transporter ATP-binding protein [Aquirhabdus parva]|uniref:Putative 2-aminoethylphosphonate ABC transporter ATP-binding protein n=2 Tax=Aquirhabdus parva TaxID=2283318 RepID=A0A345P5S7_9GAMM|nr:putative 2-aminoethylphosphonate ABC transporter ATP-binding protein [Aquirhabdus parva]